MTATVGLPEAAPPDLPDLAGEYGLCVTGVRPLPGGMENTHVKADTTSGPVVVTYLRKKSPQQAEEYAQFLRQLNRLSSHPAPRLRQRCDATWVGHHRGLPVIVCDYVPGISPPQLPGRLVHVAGRLLGEVHRDTTGLGSGLQPHLRMTPADTSTLAALPDGPLADWARRTWATIGDVPSRDGARAFIHADVFPDNIVVETQGPLPADEDDGRSEDRLLLLDWEDGCHDLCALDVAVALLGLCGPVRFDPVRARHLLAGYRTGAGTVPDLRLIRDAALYAAVLITLRRHRWHLHGQEPAASHRTAATMAHLAADLARNWPV